MRALPHKHHHDNEMYSASDVLHVAQNMLTQQIRSAMASSKPSALAFKILAECPVSKARVAVMTLPHAAVDTPSSCPWERREP